MSRILEIVQRVVDREVSRRRGSLLGVVTQLHAHTDQNDDNNYEVDVRLKHEDLELQRVPVAVPHIGVAAPPRTGDLVLVEFVGGDLAQPVVMGRFYHADDRPPLHKEDEILFEQRVKKDSTLNQLRFTDDGTIWLQRKVTKPEDNSEALASVKIDGATGDIEIRTGDKTAVRLAHDGKIEILADGQAMSIKCDKLTIEGAVEVKGDVTVASAGGQKTKISGNEITGS